MLDELGRKKIEVVLELGEALPPAPADRVQAQQVLVNLLHNGADALEAVGDRPRVLRVRTWRGGAGVVVEVSDSRGGLQDVRRVFEPFFGTKESGRVMQKMGAGSLAELVRMAARLDIPLASPPAGAGEAGRDSRH